MALKPRNMSSFSSEFCNVVEELTTLKELGFKEDGYHHWKYTLCQRGVYSKSLIASKNYLYLRDQEGEKYTDVTMCKLWNKDIAGPISKSKLVSIINFLKEGNVNEFFKKKKC